MFERVLILSASAGAGHVRAAEALKSAFKKMNAAREIRHIDTLDYTNKVFRRLYSKTYLDMVKSAPEMLGWLYDYLDQPWKKERRRLAFDRLNTRPFVKLLKDYKPDITVCTHFLPAEIISWLKAKERIAKPPAIVVTDFDIHAMWLCHHYEQYFVPLEETRTHMEKLGIPATKITVTGIPIDPIFAEHKDKIEMRGRNEELRARLVSLVTHAKRKTRVAVNVVGYTTEMDEYMSASDLILGKPGGLTTSEALAKGLVFVIVNPIPGQEERNSDHLLEEGVAIRCNNLPALAFKIDQLLDDKQRLEEMRKNVRRLARPNAATDIVNQLRKV
jgi:processive 1,2-diacylglycerol beta-glucosyltransferase